jgi:hypothetical protein
MNLKNLKDFAAEESEQITEAAKAAVTVLKL